MTSRFILIFTAIAGLFLTAGNSAHAEGSQADSYISSAQKKFAGNQRSGRDAVTNKSRNYAEKSARRNKNKTPKKHRRDNRYQKQKSSANTGVND